MNPTDTLQQQQRATLKLLSSDNKGKQISLHDDDDELPKFP